MEGAKSCSWGGVTGQNKANLLTKYSFSNISAPILVAEEAAVEQAAHEMYRILLRYVPA